jgi:hypothetical protein
VSDHWGIEGNEIIDQLERTGSEHPFIEPELVYGMSETSCQVGHQMLWEQTSTQQLGVHTWTDTCKKVSFWDPSHETLETVICKQESTETYHGTIYKVVQI